MAKAPTKAASKAPAKAANATPAAKAPATKPEAPAGSPAPKPEEKPAPDAPKPEDKGTGGDGVNEPGTTTETGSDDKLNASQTDPEQGIDLEAIKAEAYKEGYSAGFTDALGGEVGPASTGTGGEFQGDETGKADQQTAYAQAGDYDRNRVAIVALAVRTPENHRKGGLSYLVDRLAAFFDKLPEEDQFPALVIANAVADRAPVDIANGRYELLVTEGLAALNGYDLSANHQGDAYDATAAADRLETIAMPEEIEVVAEGEEAADVDTDDPNEGSSAAARMANAL